MRQRHRPMSRSRTFLTASPAAVAAPIDDHQRRRPGESACNRSLAAASWDRRRPVLPPFRSDHCIDPAEALTGTGITGGKSDGLPGAESRRRIGGPGGGRGHGDQSDEHRQPRRSMCSLCRLPGELHGGRLLRAVACRDQRDGSRLRWLVCLQYGRRGSRIEHVHRRRFTRPPSPAFRFIPRYNSPSRLPP